MATNNPLEITPQLINFIAIRLAETTAKDWSVLEDDAKKAFRAKARRILAAERKFFDTKAAKVEKPKSKADK